MKRLLILAAVLGSAAAFVLLTLPPRRQTLNALADGTIAGVLHIHTNRSDGSQGPDQVAAAAARAGVKFIVFTDHGDATRVPDPPTYRSDVLCLDGVEISTNGGHYVALDLPASPYPLGGDARDVVEDVRRLGGFGIAAHPDSPKSELRWRDWTAPINGVEFLNLDTSWRVIRAAPGWRPKLRLLEALAGYAIRPPEVIANLIQPSAIVPEWEAIARRRRVIIAAGTDAHANLPLANSDAPAEQQISWLFPGYETSFRVVSTHITPDTPLTGDASADARVVLRALRAGHFYTVVDALAGPSAFEFTASNALGRVNEGDQLGAGGPVTLRVRSNGPAAFTTVVRDGSRTIATARDANDFTVHGGDQPAVYWVEVVDTSRERPIVWVRSNPIFVRGVDPPQPAVPPAPTSSATPMFDGQTANGWRIEHDPTSLAAVDVALRVSGAELRLRWGLSGGTATAGQYAGLAYDTPAGVASSTRLAFTARAERPMRISVQLRDMDNRRWQRSEFVDTVDRPHVVAFDDMSLVADGVAAGSNSRPQLDAIRSILFVVDTTNTKAGASGRVWMKNAALER